MQWFILLVFSCFVPVSKEMLDQDADLSGVKLFKSEFPITKHDAMILDELNSIRNLVAGGSIADKVKFIEGIILLVNGVKFVVKGIEKAAEEVVEFFGKTVNKAMEWGKDALVNTADVLVDAALSIEDAISDLGNDIADIATDIGNAIGNFFSGKRKRRSTPLKGHNGSGINMAVRNEDLLYGSSFGIPKNTLGPVKNMNILTWNRRLAQLAAVSKTAYDSGNRTIEYNGKKYRMFSFGGYVEYIIANLLGEWIAKLFTMGKVAYYACYLVLCGIDTPIYDLDSVKDTIFEALDGSYVEVGCVVAPSSFCVIGPIIEPRDEMLFELGEPTSGCHYGFDKSLCLPPPSYFFALRDKYEKRLRPKISKFEIVEGSDGYMNGSEYSVQWPDEDDFSNVSLSFIQIIFIVVITMLLKK
ncbi:unnamed protein product [Caenorhabditis brenneri]